MIPVIRFIKRKHDIKEQQNEQIRNEQHDVPHTQRNSPIQSNTLDHRNDFDQDQFLKPDDIQPLEQPTVNFDIPATPIIPSTTNYNESYTQMNAEKPERVIHKLRRKLYDFVVVDIETTGLNPVYEDIIQISAIKVKADKVVDKFNYLLKPQNELSLKISYLTGITNEDLDNNGHSIQKIMPKFTEFVEDLPIVGHNILNFDLPFLFYNHYNPRELSVMDTLKLARRSNFTSEIKNYKLPTLKSYFGIMNRSHNALNDCETTLHVYRHLRDDQLDKVILSPDDFPQNLKGLRFVITGEFMSDSREDIIQKIELHGGRVTSAVSGLTDYLIDGQQVYDDLTDGEHSNKELKAMEYKKNGGKIKIIGLDDFEKIFNEADALVS